MNIYEVIEAQRAALLNREYATVRDLVRAYERAERWIIRAINHYRRKITRAEGSGAEVSLAWVYQEVRLRNVLIDVRLQLAEFSKDALEFTERARKEAFDLGAVHALRLAEVSVYGDIAGLNSAAFANAQAALSAASPLKILLETISPDAVEVMREAFARAFSEGWGPLRTARYVRRKVKAVSLDRAKLIARTETNRFYRSASHQVYKANTGVLRGWRWTSAKTPATCIFCLAMDGEVFPADQLLQSHPACRCSMVPLPEHDFGGPQPTLGSDYFSRLPREDKLRHLGPTKLGMYERGEITLKDNVKFVESPKWGRQPRGHRIDELTKLRDSGGLHSQTPNATLSGYSPPPPIMFNFSSPTVELAIAKWRDKPSRGVHYDRWAPRFRYLRRSSESRLEQVMITSLRSWIKTIPPDRVEFYIRNLGDGPDLPTVIQDGARVYVYGVESLARIEAKRLLGKTRVSVRVYQTNSLRAKLRGEW